jgi:hypothetical protein
VILIESGGYRNDPEKQVIRQLNFTAILTALHLITEKTYTTYALEDYFKIPVNERNLFDLVIRHVNYEQYGISTKLDIGINQNEMETTSAPMGFYHHSSIEEIGDLHNFHGYQELNGEGLTLIPGRVYPEIFENVPSLLPEKIIEFLASGYTTIKVAKLPDAKLCPLALPLNITTCSAMESHDLTLEKEANFVLKDSSGQVRYAIVNGFAHNLAETMPALFHGVIL